LGGATYLDVGVEELRQAVEVSRAVALVGELADMQVVRIHAAAK
jgi:hypothetical protein